MVEGRTGVFFNEPTGSAISTALDDFAGADFDPHIIAAHAAEFGEARFTATLQERVASFVTT